MSERSVDVENAEEDAPTEISGEENDNAEVEEQRYQL